MFCRKFHSIYHWNVICGTNLWLNRLYKTTISHTFRRDRKTKPYQKEKKKIIMMKMCVEWMMPFFFKIFPFFYYSVEINWMQLFRTGERERAWNILFLWNGDQTYSCWLLSFIVDSFLRRVPWSIFNGALRFFFAQKQKTYSSLMALINGRCITWC